MSIQPTVAQVTKSVRVVTGTYMSVARGIAEAVIDSGVFITAASPADIEAVLTAARTSELWREALAERLYEQYCTATVGGAE